MFTISFYSFLTIKSNPQKSRIKQKKIVHSCKLILKGIKKNQKTNIVAKIIIFTLLSSLKVQKSFFFFK